MFSNRTQSKKNYENVVIRIFLLFDQSTEKKQNKKKGKKGDILKGVIINTSAT